MSKKKMVDRPALVAAVAYEKSLGKLQQTIASDLDISQPEVSRLLTEALADGWLEKPSFRIVDNDVWQRAEERFYSTTALRDELRARYRREGRKLHRISLFHTREDGSVDPRTAAIFRVLLGEAATVGVTWGYRVSDVVEALRQRGTDMPGSGRTGKVTFVPLCGEPLSVGDPASCSSSVLAQRLAEIFGGAEDTVESIAGVPAFIPLKVGKASEVETIRRLISLVRGHARIFGSPGGSGRTGKPLVETLDAIITSVGRVGQNRGIFLSERIEIGDISEERMTRSVAGDIGGIIIPNAGISAADAKSIQEMNNNWTGARQDHLRRCADAAQRGAFSRKTPGVIVLALGADRVTVVLRCIELGLVNELVIDRELADALHAHLQPA